MVGPPGAGKTTALLSLAAVHPSLARFGVRDYGLDLADAGHPLGLELRGDLLRGALLSDRLVRQEFTHFLDHLPKRADVVTVEGYPRDLAQTEDFFEVVRAAGARVAAMVVIDAPDDLLWTRVAQRKICATCGRPVAGDAAIRCPRCGGSVVRRGDDEEERVARRVADYRRLAAEVGEYFGQRDLLRTVDGTRGVAVVREELQEVLMSDDR
ncbi:adenylate kinase family protein [Micromonospora sp. NPDC048935]|uniref:adenylate kinase family protein n=1 Tax=Micromonospora sp. NPDC048935 TaxID=3364262 RepID=UPI003715693C